MYNIYLIVDKVFFNILFYYYYYLSEFENYRSDHIINVSKLGFAFQVSRNEGPQLNLNYNNHLTTSTLLLLQYNKAVE